MKKPNLFVRLLSALWTGVNGVRKILHLILLLMIFGVFFGAMAGAPPGMPDRAALLLQPGGYLVDQLAGDPFERAFQEAFGEGVQQVLIKDFVDALAYAKDDERIEAVHLELSGFAGGGLSKLRRIAVAIEDFRSSGKPVIASGDFLTQGGLYLGAHADELYILPESLVILQGYGGFRTYFRDAIDKLRLDWNIFRVGTYKSFIEPFTRMDMSEEDRESTQDLIDQLWTMYDADVSAALGLESGSIAAYADTVVELAAAAGGDLGAAARDRGLVDDLLTRHQVRDRMIELVGRDAETGDTYQSIGVRDYLDMQRLMNGGATGGDEVAIVVASGEFLFGDHPPGTVGGDSVSALLRRALNDDSVQAVVLRIDSPGGSMLASEVIAHEIAVLRNAGKPVVASMSSVAASAGYFIAAGTDRIFASSASITGSIGIFGMFPTYQRTAAALGIANDGVGTTILSGEFRPDREMSEPSKQLFQLVVNDGYDDFLSHVANFRGMPKEAVDAVGQGRAWTGDDALAHGLIDAIGTLEDAVVAAAELAGLKEGEYGEVVIEEELSPEERFIIDLFTVAKRAGVNLGSFGQRPSSLERIAERIENALEPLTRFNDPKGIYSHCFCRFE